MTLSSAYIELFIRGKSPGGCPRGGGMSGYPCNIRINLYYTMIHPYLAYCNFVWASNYQARPKRLIVPQNRAIRVIIGCFNVQGRNMGECTETVKIRGK